MASHIPAKTLFAAGLRHKAFLTRSWRFEIWDVDLDLNLGFVIIDKGT